MQFSTPSGSVFGVDELATKIRAARSTKPVVGIADSMAASAGYYLLSQCSEAYCTPGGQVGSIGVYAAHEFIGKALDEAGIKIELISAGKYKVEGNPFEPLGDEARAEMQAMVDRYYAAFVSAVAKGRGVSADKVRSDFGQGRVLSAQDALAAGMVDGVMPFDAVVRKMAAASRQREAAKARAAVAIAGAI
jgi:signal peptide peptidase SppA